jgi:hypothetical protein
VPKTVLTAAPLRKLRRRSHTRQSDQHVHFHRGPQGRPMPCYDDRCTIPHLSIQ